MKRGWFGVGLLAVLLALGIFSSVAMGLFHEPVADVLERASDYALEENWDQARRLSGRAEDTWEELWHFSASFADHSPMEEIDSLFAQLEIYEKARDPVAFAAVCASLSRQLEAMSDAHELSWWNLL